MDAVRRKRAIEGMAMRKRLLCVGMVICLGLWACGGGGGGNGDGDCTTPSSGTSMTAAEDALGAEVLNLVNAERTGRSLDPVSWHGGLAQVGFEHSWDMNTRGFFAHENPCGEGPDTRVSRAGIGWTAVAENIARGQATAMAVMVAWMDSSGHRANILNGQMTHIGIGVYQVGGDTYWTMVLIRAP